MPPDKANPWLLFSLLKGNPQVFPGKGKVIFVGAPRFKPCRMVGRGKIEGLSFR
jgi:hypothetical protein